MAVRCGTYDLSRPSPADLVPGVKTLYTREGQAVTIVAAHVDQGKRTVDSDIVVGVVDVSARPLFRSYVE